MTPSVSEVKENNYAAAQKTTVAATTTSVYYPPTSTGSTTSANRYANGANQNCGNVITDRPTTKVHGPPGGRSSIVFG